MLDCLDEVVESDVGFRRFWKVFFFSFTHRLLPCREPYVPVFWRLAEDLNCFLILLTDGPLVRGLPSTRVFLQLLIPVVETFCGGAGTSVILLGDRFGDLVLKALDVGSLGIVVLLPLNVDILGELVVPALVGIKAC